MAERTRLERDGDLGVLVIDSQPLNLETFLADGPGNATFGGS